MRHLRRNYWLQLTYYAAFVPGMQRIIAEVLKQRLADVSILKLLDGAVLFETECTYDRLNFFCFNNIFLVVDILETNTQDAGHGQNTGPDVLELHMKKILAAAGKSGSASPKPWSIIGENNKKIKTFRLFFSLENKPVQVNESLKQQMEAFVARHSSLQLSRGKPDTEFWFLYRSEGFSCFMKRLTNHRINEKSLHKGELSPQLAWLLCHLAELKHGEIVIDPFCGYGAIPNAVCKHFPIEKCFAADIDPQCVKKTKSHSSIAAGLRTNRCEIFHSGFHTLTQTIPGITNSIDAVITDPPWGMYKSDIPLQTSYIEMMEVFSKLLKNNGRVVILTAAVTELENALTKTPAFHIDKIIPILVSGKKASVFVLTTRFLSCPG